MNHRNSQLLNRLGLTWRSFFANNYVPPLSPRSAALAVGVLGMIFGGSLLPEAAWASTTIHQYRFETDPGFVVDSGGTADLSINGPVAQVRLPSTGRGASFPQGFQLEGLTVNLAGADFDSTGDLTSDDFIGGGITFEALFHIDTLTDCHWIAESRDLTAKVCAAASQGVDSVGELTISSHQNTMVSVLVQTGIDYYLAASVADTSSPNVDRDFCGGDPGPRQLDLWIQNLSDGSALEHKATTWSTNCALLSFGFHIGRLFDGLIDEVRFSSGQLSSSDLLVNLVNEDADADGVENRSDNCITHENTDQRDTDSDGVGNACDADLNNDCSVNFLDLGLMKSVFFSSDANSDLNGDGRVNFSDLGIIKQAIFQPPGPSGVPNVCDGN